MDNMRFDIVFKSGVTEIARVHGLRDVPTGELTVEQVTAEVLRTESFLEKLTGLRVHIEQVL